MQYLFLENLILYGSHGVYADEERLGNRFELDIKIFANFEQAAQTDRLDQTVDYEEIFEILKQEAAKPVHLLEHLAHNMIQALRKLKKIDSVELKIKKCNPPLKGEVGSSGFFIQANFS
jgi:dihydroneopterin aldolase